MRKLFQKSSEIITVLLLFFIWVFSFDCFASEKPDLTVIGFFEMSDGIGIQTAELIDAFKEELSIGFLHTQEPKYSDVPFAVEKIAKEQKALGNVLWLYDNVDLPNSQTLQKVLNIKTKEQILIAYSLFEADSLPKEWVDALNDHFDAVVVPDPWCVTVYEKSGVKIPIFELPIAMDLDPYLCKPLKSVRNKIFTFGYIGSGAERKNLLKLVQSFSLAFNNHYAVQLNISYKDLDLSSLLKIKYEIARMNLNNIKLTQQTLSKDSYIKLLSSSDCIVSISKGEGFSRQPREAMALGIPVIVTNNSAQMTLCETGLVKSIPSFYMSPYLFTPLKKISGNVSDCEVTDVAAALKDVVANYNSYLNLNKISREWVSFYGYKHLKPYYRALIKPKKVSLGNENKVEKDHLITTSSRLYEKYRKLLDHDETN